MHLHAVAIVVPDYDSAIAFFCDTLGFDLTEDTPLDAGKRWVLVTPPGGETHILIARAVQPEQAAAIGQQTGGRVGFFLHSQDFDSDYRQMKARGVNFEETPRTEPYGKVAVFRDPWGNRWDLLQLM